jgi:predicted GNAT superfamily acetyltransferase
MSSEIVISSLTTMEECTEIVALQKTIWAFEDDTELLPPRVIVVAVKIGGQAFGAYDNGRMIAFLVAFAATKADGHKYLHSQMLGVLPEYRNTGIGKRLKMYQRDDALARGYDLIEWTFDPLQLKNAWFNIEGLGAIVRRYERNLYGTSTSALQGGLPTDRCIAEWWIQKPRPMPDIVERLPVPPVRSRAVQEMVASHFEAAFAKGLAVVGVKRIEDSIEYLFGEVKE